MSIFITLIGVLVPTLVALLGFAERGEKRQREMLKLEIALFKDLEPGSVASKNVQTVMNVRTRGWVANYAYAYTNFILKMSIVLMLLGVGLTIATVLYTKDDNLNKFLGSAAFSSITTAVITATYARIWRARSNRAVRKRSEAKKAARQALIDQNIPEAPQTPSSPS